MVDSRSEGRPAVLLVEDNEPDAVYIEELFAELEWSDADAGTEAGDRTDEPRLVTVGTVTACRRRLDADDFDIVLLDLHLPDSTNLDTVDRVLSDTTDETVVVLTGLDDGRVGSAAVERGAEDYVIKNELTATVLDRTIRDAMEGKAR